MAEAHHTVGRREQRVIAAAPHVVARVEPGASLAHDDRAGPDLGSAEHLDPKPLGSGVSTVARGAGALLLRHLYCSFAFGLVVLRGAVDFLPAVFFAVGVPRLAGVRLAGAALVTVAFAGPACAGVRLAGVRWAGLAFAGAASRVGSGAVSVLSPARISVISRTEWIWRWPHRRRWFVLGL